MRNYPYKPRGVKVRAIRHPKNDKERSLIFPVKGGAVRITRKWLILSDFNPATPQSKFGITVARAVCLILAIVLSCFSLWLGSWELALILSAVCYIAYRSKLWRIWNEHSGQGSAKIELSHVNKISLLYGIPFFWYSRIIIDYRDDRGYGKLLPIIVEGSFFNAKSHAAQVARAVKDINMLIRQNK